MSDDWMKQGACREVADLELFFPDYENGSHARQREKADQAKRICWGCPVRLECRAYAYAWKIQDGIWGGVWLDRGRKRSKKEEAA